MSPSLHLSVGFQWDRRKGEDLYKLMTRSSGHQGRCHYRLTSISQCGLAFLFHEDPRGVTVSVKTRVGY